MIGSSKILISIVADSDADLLLQLLEGHLGALALRRRPLAVHVDGGAPAMRVGRVNEIRDKSRDCTGGHVSEKEAGSGGISMGSAKVLKIILIVIIFHYIP